MRKYDYSIEEMHQIINDFNERGKTNKNYEEIKEMLQTISEFNDRDKIITEYKEMEGIEIITEEEMTNLFGTTFFYYNIYANVHYFNHYDFYMYISDYEQYQIDNGYDPFMADFIDNLDESYVEPWLYFYESLDNLEIMSDLD